MLTYNFENIKGPLYQYICECVKKDIISGNLKAGEKLPSKRSFARNNGVSTITIQTAYDQLISEGYVYSVPKKGYFVAELAGLTRIPKASGVSLGIKLPKAPDNGMVDLSSRVRADSFPFSIWAKLSREVISQKSKELMEISPSEGISDIRAAISTHLHSFRGMLTDPDQIIIGAGTEYLYGLLIQLLGRDKCYGIENPGYSKLARIYKYHNVNCRFVDIDKNGISAQGLKESKTDIAHITPTHHFPTGITMPAARRYEVLAWACEAEGRYIIEDDYDSEFRQNGKPIPPFFSMDGCEKVIYMNTFSKTLSPTIRVSYMVLPAHLAKRFNEQLSFYSCTVSNFEQYTLASFIERGYFERHINRMRLYYTRLRGNVMDIIKNSPLNERCEIIENDSGLHFLLRLKTDKPDAVISSELRERGIRLNALSDYYLTSSNVKQHYFIINYSNVAPGDVEYAANIIPQYL